MIKSKSYMYFSYPDYTVDNLEYQREKLNGSRVWDGRERIMIKIKIVLLHQNFSEYCTLST